jgi:hypothetical protein
MRYGRIALVAALMVGVAGDILLRAGPWGAGLSLSMVLDVQYLSRLSGDAVPTPTTHAARLPSAVRDTLMTALAARWTGLGQRDWRSWNLGYARATGALAGAVGRLPR